MPPVWASTDQMLNGYFYLSGRGMTDMGYPYGSFWDPRKHKSGTGVFLNMVPYGTPFPQEN